MKVSIYLFLITAVVLGVSATAQTADEIIENYLEASGGEEQWEKLTATKMIAEVDYEGMPLPITIYNTKEGKQAIKLTYNNQEITQLAYDGEVLWATNSNMKPQKADEESTQNMAHSRNDFPNPFLNYKNNNYELKLMGKTVVEGKEAYKILLIQEPIIIDGLKEENISYYYFDTESFLPIMMEKEVKSGPLKGQLSVSSMKDYKKVKKLYFPFSINENGQEIKIKKVILNPHLDEDIFQFPEQ